MLGDAFPGPPRECEYLVLTRVLLATQALEQALVLLERLHAPAATQGRTAGLIQVRTLQALAVVRAREQGCCPSRPPIASSTSVRPHALPAA